LIQPKVLVLPLPTPSRRLSGKSDYKYPHFDYAYEGNRETLEYMRTNLPNTIVNIFGVSKGKLSCYDSWFITQYMDYPIVSDIFTLTKGQSYCQNLGLPHFNIECTCALLDGDVGKHTRDMMDDLMNQYSAYSRSPELV
jgi:phospholipase B1